MARNTEQVVGELGTHIAIASPSQEPPGLSAPLVMEWRRGGQ